MISGLVREGQAHKSLDGRWYGLSLYRANDGAFSAVIRTRTYDGIRVESKWDTPAVQLDATDVDAAWAEATVKLNEYVTAICGPKVGQ